MKHVTVLPELRRGVPSFFLLGPDGRVRAFDLFAESLRKSPFNTVESYSYGAARFFDYLFEAAELFGQGAENAARTQDQLVELLDSYDDYLVYGEDSGNELVRQLSRSNPSPRVSARTSEQLHAPLRLLLKLSDTIRLQSAQLAEHGLVEYQVAKDALTATLSYPPTALQRVALYRNSMLHGVIAGGDRLLHHSILPTGLAGLADETTEEQAFPFDLIEPVICEMTSHRDKALYAFSAASGCRISEALQVLWSDIDQRNMTVKLVNPKRRVNSPSYLYLTAEDRKKHLVWKARATQSTLLIEPFATIFFQELEAYRASEWKWNESHDFVFQHVNPKYLGRPFLLSSRSSRGEAFKKAVNAVRNKTGDLRLIYSYGVHSLRHTYGFYLLNYFPRKNGSHGLPIGLVKQVMGHAQQKTTAKYARHDTDLIEEDLAYANTKIFGDGAARSLTHVKHSILLKRLERLEIEMREEAALAVAR